MTPDIRLERNGDHWRAVWTDANGRRRRKGLGNIAKVSRPAAQRACRRLMAEFAGNPLMVRLDDRHTLTTWKARYEALRAPELDAKTLDLHRATLDRLASFLGADTRLAKVGKRDAADWRASLQAEGLSPATVARHVRQAKTIWRLAMRENAAAECPFDGLPSNVRMDGPAFIPPDEAVDALIDAAADRPSWHCLIGMCALAGLRLGEAERMGWAGVDHDRRRLIVEHVGQQTTKRRTREAYMEPRLATILREGQREGLSRPVELGARNRQRDVRVIFKAARLTPWPKPFHTLRYWRATTWRDKYPEHVVDAWLGHGAEVARKHYVKVPEAYYRGEDENAALRAEVERLRKELEAKS